MTGCPKGHSSHNEGKKRNGYEVGSRSLRRWLENMVSSQKARLVAMTENEKG